MAVKKNPPLADALADIAAAAVGLRRAGVTKVTVGDITVCLAPDLPPVAPPPSESRDVDLGNVDDFLGETRLRIPAGEEPS